MSCASECGDSQSSLSSESDSLNEELCSDFSKLKPYSFEPIISSDEDEDPPIVTTFMEEKVVENSRVGNVDWCLCNCCKPMDSEVESFCCKETNELPEELFEGKLYLAVFNVFLLYVC